MSRYVPLCDDCGGWDYPYHDCEPPMKAMSTRLNEADERVHKLERDIVNIVTGYFERRDRTPIAFMSDLERLAKLLDSAYVEATNAEIQRRRESERP